MNKDLHGGNIYKFQREGKNDILDYSSNINPLGVPQKFIDIVAIRDTIYKIFTDFFISS